MTVVSPSKWCYLSCLWTPCSERAAKSEQQQTPASSLSDAPFWKSPIPLPFTPSPIGFPKTDTVQYPPNFPLLHELPPSSSSSTYTRGSVLIIRPLVDDLHLVLLCLPVSYAVCFGYVHLVGCRRLTMFRCIFAVPSFVIDLQLLFFPPFPRVMPVLHT